MQRRILAILSVSLLLGSLGVLLWRPESQGLLAFCWRAGALTAAAWLAYDDVQRLPGWLLFAVPIVLIAAARWPRLLLTLLPLLLVWAVVRKVLGGR